MFWKKYFCSLAVSLGLLLTVVAYAEHKEYGCQSMVKRLHKVLVKRPDTAFAVEDAAKWHYTSVPSITIAQQEHDAFVKILQSEGVEVCYHNEFLPQHADAIFVHDPVIVTDHGAIILKMGKPLRVGEEAALQRTLEKLGIPILGVLTGDATAEGGDTLWLDATTLAIGHGFRTNAQGIAQIKALVEPFGIQVITVDLPYFQGEDACLHLQSLISLVDEKLAVVYLPLLSVAFVQLLIEKGSQLIAIDEQEFQNMGSNIVALAPGVCVAIEGNDRIKAELETRGVKVYCYKGNEISLKAEGGATCLTRPLMRE